MTREDDPGAHPPEDAAVRRVERLREMTGAWAGIVRTATGWRLTPGPVAERISRDPKACERQP